ncbi:3-hydroxyacyl-CoA dehydrogenase NAD-binding domain-containing protein [Chitinophaga tropicalis]|uniref:3-hydroxybutyryl-CoA dehydrogenase n=1 Tax=Chitinophaga tropicalis TaxID=2683588 RepID=A0A7K1TYB6_9BACT|nr:3-hydroxyacyl-CoA dehydrogenase NAD-binding domain-containing protein [Chitinophaga tropicalis]MVT07082.1 3-hydroxybutyryl-CoA dehydrogenase [Chitinophaga tropicalis]
MITTDHIKVIAVCGAGTMGAGIAQVAAMSGFRTILFDVQPAILDKARQQIMQQLDTAVAKGKLAAAEKDAVFQRIQFTEDVNSCKADVVIEAIVEKLAVKTALFNQLATINSEETILASNTSSLSVTAIAAATTHPERVAGMHFFNPAPVMKLVEIVSGEQTLPVVAQQLYQLAVRMGKTAVMAKDTPGFIVNRVARHYYLEAMEIAEDGVADYRTIDRLLESAGFRMGPFALMDLIGNDVNLAVTRSLYDAYGGAPRFAPNRLQIEKVEQGQLGKKSGKGFYNYL